VSSFPQIVYAAATTTCTFLLDGDGICRRVVMRVHGTRPAEIARRCLGAQYVASLSMVSDQGLVERPEPGAHLLFARTENGRVSLVKTAELEHFETYDEDADDYAVVADDELDETNDLGTEPRGQVLESGFELTGGHSASGHNDCEPEEDEIETDPFARDLRPSSAVLTSAPELADLEPYEIDDSCYEQEEGSVTVRGNAYFQQPDPSVARRYQDLLERAAYSDAPPRPAYLQTPRVPILGVLPKRTATFGRK